MSRGFVLSTKLHDVMSENLNFNVGKKTPPPVHNNKTVYIIAFGYCDRSELEGDV
jgi:hypothetical protein